MTTKTKVFDFTGEDYRELTDAVRCVENWINDNLAGPTDVIAINHWPDESGHTFVVWYREVTALERSIDEQKI